MASTRQAGDQDAGPHIPAQAAQAPGHHGDKAVIKQCFSVPIKGAKPERRKTSASPLQSD